ncbi:MAG: O-antigen ligase family protein [Caldilineaceae bacterium]
MSLVLAMVVMGYWLLGFIINKHQERLLPSPINRPIWIFVIISIVAYGWGVVLRDPLVYVPGSFVVTQAAALLVNILLPLLALLVSNKLVDLKWWRTLAWIMVGLGAFHFVSVELNLPTQQLISNGSRGLFTAWVTGIAYALALFDEEQPLWRRGLLLVLVAAFLYQSMIKNTLWLSGWIPTLIICVVVTFYRSKKLFALGVLVGLVILAINAGTIYERVVVANVDEGGTERLEIWSMNLAHVAKHPFFGMGPAGYAVYNMTYHPLDARSTHNNYFDVLAQTGIIGFVAFLWMQWRFLVLGMKNCRRVTHKRNFSAALGAVTLGGAVAAMVAMMLGDWVLPFAYNQTISGFDNAAYTWIFLGGIAALAHMLDGEGIGEP